MSDDALSVREVVPLVEGAAEHMLPATVAAARDVELELPVVRQLVVGVEGASEDRHVAD